MQRRMNPWLKKFCLNVENLLYSARCLGALRSLGKLFIDYR